jgi:purine-binding chemotaxis protein CheW
MELAPENLRAAPEVDSVIDSDAVIGLGSLADRMLILLDIEKLMSGVDMGLVS